MVGSAMMESQVALEISKLWCWLRSFDSKAKWVDEDMKEVDMNKAKGIISKVIKDFQATIDFLVKKIAAATKAVEDFQASPEF